MIIQFNPTKLCKQPFFMKIVNYLYLNQPVTLRAIKRQFPFQKNIDKLIEEFVKEGYIERFEKRYRLLISLVSDSSKIDLEQHFFINDDSTCYLELLNIMQIWNYFFDRIETSVKQSNQYYFSKNNKFWL